MIVALVMLVVIAMMGATVVRSSMNTELVANNSRLQNFAAKAADFALRDCERRVLDPAGATLQPTAFVGGAMQWNSLNNWTANLDVAGAALGKVTLTKAPQCMAEFGDAGNTFVVVTARGFSPDYTADAKGHTQTGSVVWVQSFLTLN
jgi:Tfp pilus assembly protein PilX